MSAVWWFFLLGVACLSVVRFVNGLIRSLLVLLFVVCTIAGIYFAVNGSLYWAMERSSGEVNRIITQSPNGLKPLAGFLSTVFNSIKNFFEM